MFTRRSENLLPTCCRWQRAGFRMLMGLAFCHQAANCLDAANVAVTAASVDAEIQTLVMRLKAAQRADGSWDYAGNVPGFTALNVLALSTSGLTEGDPAVRRAVQYLLDNFPRGSTYGIALYAAALQSVDAQTYWPEIKRAADWLISRQHSGTWNYTGTFAGDHSVTQFAMLGIKAALDARVPVPLHVLRATESHFRQSQNPDGGWTYRGSGKTLPSMTPAGLSSLYVCGVEEARSLELDKGPAFIGQYAEDAAVARGIARMARQLDFANPYTAYGIERVGIFYDRRYFADVDWYRAGCAAILAGKIRGNAQHCPDQFRLLFLAKGNTPVLASKLHWGAPRSDDWNLRRYDVRHLVQHLSEVFKTPLDWQVVTLAQDSEDLARAPLLYISGYRTFTLDDAQQKALDLFVRNGGTVLFAPDLGSREFIQSAIRVLRAIYPGSRFEKLPRHHELRGMYHDLYDVDLPVRVVRHGCAELRIFFLEDDLSLEFEGAKPTSEALQLAANFARYAMKAKPLVKRLSRSVLEEPRSESPREPQLAAAGGARPGGLNLAQLVYDGEADPDPAALDNFLGFLRGALDMPTAPEARRIKAADPDLRRQPVLYLTGHDGLSFSAPEREALRNYLQHGGFLVADACCSRETFDTAFRELVKTLFGGRALAPIPLDSPLYHEPFELKPELTPPAAGLFDQRPEYLWGFRQAERYVIVYSPVDFGCSMDGHLTEDIRGFTAPSSYHILTNIVSYGLSY